VKHCVIILDGAAGWPLAGLGGNTTLSAARTPHLDALAREGTVGMAVTVPEGASSSPISYDWYKDFINFLLNGNHEGWFAYVITFGEIAVGIGLLLGALTGIAAFFGALMNMSFLLAGSASSNPVLFTAAIGLILAWRVAGYYGVDRYLLPMLGTPWRAPVRTTPSPPVGTT